MATVLLVLAQPGPPDALREQKPQGNMSAKPKATKSFREDLQAVLAKHGMELLTDDGLWMWVDDYTDSYLFYARPTGWVAQWRARHDSAKWDPVFEPKKKADPVSEIGPCHVCGETLIWCGCAT